jgi:hypothetical protein
MIVRIWKFLPNPHYQAARKRLPGHFCSCSPINQEEDVTVGSEPEVFRAQLAVVLGTSIAVSQLYFNHIRVQQLVHLFCE